MFYDEIGENNKLLVENINYSPSFLEPFCKEGLCGLCLDIGHLLLGQEDVMEVMRQAVKKM
jgi:sugar phosphate isomerase/epimerase